MRRLDTIGVEDFLEMWITTVVEKTAHGTTELTTRVH